ncbi:hypothetical protein HDU98_012060 [Podochytrium sp. JEL0797]|nr:hypothetical protein HDU98_012060 [Podochytrium sp. JEL0797]
MSEIVTVVAKPTGDDEDPDLVRLAAVPRIQPLLSDSVDSTSSGFNWFGSAKKTEAAFVLDSRPLETILVTLRSHAETAAKSVNDQQRIISERLAKIDRRAGEVAAEVSAKNKQTKARNEVAERVASIEYAAVNTRVMLDDILASIAKFDALLLPHERLNHPENILRNNRQKTSS